MPIYYPQTLHSFLLRRLIIIACLFFLSLGSIHAQHNSTDGTTPMGLSSGAPAGSYSLNGFENINFFNGNLNISLPLLSVNGRGGASVPIVLRVEQRWRAEQWYDGYNNPYYYAQPIWWNAEVLTFNPGHMIARQEGDYHKDCYPFCTNGTGCTFHNTLTRLTFVSADGTEHEFRDQLWEGKPLEPSCNAADGPSRGRVFVSSDSTSMIFIADEDIHDNMSYSASVPVSGYLKMSDGTTYRIDLGMVQSIRDRNGNSISFEYGWDYDPAHMINSTIPQTKVLTKITDSLKREVIFHYNVTDPQYGLCNQITFKGFAGASRTITISYADLQQTLRSDQVLRKYNQLFPGFNGPSTGPNDPNSYFNPKKVAAVYLPNGKSYQFHYTNYGELARLDLPTQGWIEYDYADGIRFIDTGYPRPVHSNDIDLYRRLTTRRDAAGNTMTISRPESEEVVFGSPGNSQYFDDGYIDVHQYDRGQRVALTRHYFYGTATATMDAAQIALYYNPWKVGREWKTEVYDKDATTLLRIVEQHWEQRAHLSWATPPPGQNGDSEPSVDPRIYETITTLADVVPNKITKEVFTYDADPNIKYNSLTDTRVYDYGNGAAGTLLRHTHTDYLNYLRFNNGVDYTSNEIHMLNLPVEQSLYGLNANGQEIKLARTTYEYDDYSTADGRHAGLINYSDISGLCTWFNSSYQCVNINPTDGSDSSGYKTRGNVTGVSRWLLNNAGNPVGAPVIASMQYDIAGNPVKAIDPRDKITAFDFADNFGSPNDNNSRNNTAPTEWLTTGKSYAFMRKATNALGHISYTQFDYYTGKPVDVEDSNGTVMSAYYNDLLDRTKQIVSAANVPALRSHMTIDYNDSLRRVKLYSDQNAYDDQALKRETYYDTLGRPYEMRVFDDAALPGQYIARTTVYDSLGRVVESSNPYRPTLGETALYTTTEYDSLGRIKQVTAPGSQPVISDFEGNTLTVMDQAGKKRMSTADALGRLTQIIEDPDNLHYVTNYTYDALGNLRKVGQGAQERYFAYDSLGRLARTKNPEQDVNAGLVSLTDPITNWSQWATAYTYDEQGNPKTMTDPRGIVTTNSYDELNRLKTISYTNDPTSTAPVTYTYDAPGVLNSKGKLTSVSSSVSNYNYTEYDALGRLKGSTQVTDGQTYTMSYGYNLAGDLTSQTYPSGRVVTTSYDLAGRVAAVDGQKASQTTHYLSAIKYWSFGGVKEMRFGNGLWEHRQFNERLQPTQVGLGASNVDSSTLRLDYSYGVVGTNGVLDTTRNNGNLQSQSLTVPGITSPLIQTYTYDALNRLTLAQENNGTSWKQTFTFDQFGNRSIDATNTTSDMVGENPQFSGLNNRIIPRQSEHYHYDAAGNLDQDKAGLYLTYDADGRVSAFNGGAVIGTGGTSYYFDGLGQRVKKATYYTATVFVYDAFGQLIAEYASAGSSSTAATNYITTDALGTPRVITGGDGEVKSRHDYVPFGEEIGGPQVSLKGGRSSAQKYVSDTLRQQFTGQERDAESGLDYFKARDYASQQGRFTSVDPLLASAQVVNPQTMNRYAYVLNNPLRFTDPSGMLAVGGDVLDTQQEEEEKKKKQREEDANKLFVDRRDVVIIEVNLSKVGVAPSKFDAANGAAPFGNTPLATAMPGMFLFTVPEKGNGVAGGSGGGPGGPIGGGGGGGGSSSGGGCLPCIFSPGSRIISLGLSPYNQGLARATGAIPYTEWETFALTRRSILPGASFGRAFNQAASRADGIFFALDGMNSRYSFQDAFWYGSRGFIPRPGPWGSSNITNAEFYNVLTNPALSPKTTFFFNNQPTQFDFRFR